MIWVEKLKYYLEWFNVYNKVEVILIMYDVGGLIELDFLLVEKMEKFK